MLVCRLYNLKVLFCASRTQHLDMLFCASRAEHLFRFGFSEAWEFTQAFELLVDFFDNSSSSSTNYKHSFHRDLGNSQK